jgi:hypothetical protein
VSEIASQEKQEVASTLEVSKRSLASTKHQRPALDGCITGGESGVDRPRKYCFKDQIPLKKAPDVKNSNVELMMWSTAGEPNVANPRNGYTGW